MKRLISYPLIFIMLLMLSVGLHAKEPTKTKKAPEFLFVITAKSAEIKQIGKNRYTLTMNHTDVDHVLMFSDRPYRLAKYITADELAKMWQVGINSFEKDPPNAGLVAHGFKHATVVELLGMDVNKQQVVYHFSFLDGSEIVSGQLIGIGLTIDGDDGCGPGEGGCWIIESR